MITVPEIVAEIVRRTPYIEESLAKGVVNVSGLAREIQNEVEERTMKKVQQGSIIMALKRMKIPLHAENKLNKIFSQMPDIIVRSNLFELTIANSHTLIEKQKQLLLFASQNTAQFTTITHGIFETTIIASNETEEMMYKLYKDEKIISEIANLSSITVKFSQDIIDVPGVYYLVLKTLAWEGIELTEIVSTFSEVTLILKQENVDRAFHLIKKLFTKSRHASSNNYL